MSSVPDRLDPDPFDDIPLVPDPRAVRVGRDGRVPVEHLPPRWSWLGWVLDDLVPVPGTGGRRRFGVDGALSFIPGVGDVTGFALSAAIILAAAQAGVSKPTMARMTMNAGGEALVGMIPVLGTLISFVWKANNRNLRLIQADLEDPDRTRRRSVGMLFAVSLVLVTGAIVSLIGVLLVPILVVWLVARWF